MANDIPQDLQQVLIRLGEMSKELAFLKSELARKDKIIAGLKQRLLRTRTAKRPHRRRENQTPRESAAPRPTGSRKT